MAWWYEKGGLARGPVSSDELQSFILKNQLPTNTLVWCSGMGEWHTYDSLVSDFGPDVIIWCATNMTDYHDHTLTPPTIPGKDNKSETAESTKKIIYYDHNTNKNNVANYKPHSSYRYKNNQDKEITLSLIGVLALFFVVIAALLLIVRYDILPGFFVTSTVIAVVLFAAIKDWADSIKSFLSKDSDVRFEMVYSKRNIAIYLVACMIAVIAKQNSIGLFGCVVLTIAASLVSIFIGFIILFVLTLIFHVVGANKILPAITDNIDWLVPLLGFVSLMFMLFK